MPFYSFGRPNQVLFRGPIDLTRRSNGAKHNCLLFTFEHEGITYEEARIALQSWNIRTRFGGGVKIDAIRQKSENAISKPGHPLVVEVHPENDSRSCVHSFLKRIEDEGGCMIWRRDNRDVRVKVQSTIPRQPVYNFYTIWDMPLGDSDTLQGDLKKAIIDALQKRYHLKQHKLDEIVVDIVAVLSLDANGKTPLYSGTFQVVLSTLLVEVGQDDEIPFFLYGDRYTLSEPTTHYLYCTRCKILDSHEHDEYNTYCSHY